MSDEIIRKTFKGVDRYNYLAYGSGVNDREWIIVHLIDESGVLTLFLKRR